MNRLVIAGVLLVPITASARDAMRAVCTGSATLETSPRQILKIAVKYDEERAGVVAGQQQRQTTLRMGAHGKTYEGRTITTYDNKKAPDPKIAIKLPELTDKTDILFDGTVEPLANDGLELVGTYMFDGKKVKMRAILECTEI